MDDGSKCRLLALLKKLLPEFNEILNQVKDGRGFLNFPSGFADWLIADGLPPWSHFYKSKNAFKTLGVRAITDPGYLDELKASGQGLSSEYVNEVKEAVVEEVLTGDFLDVSDEEILDSQETIENWESLSEDEKNSHLKTIYLLLYTIVTQSAYFMSLVTFGRHICDLVADAENGDDDAFCKAVQIDKTILFGIPYFQKRLVRAQLGSDPEFLHKLALALESPSLGRKISYPQLMFVFAILDDEGLLDMPLDELLTFCEELGVYGREYGVEDTESLRKRRKYYRDRTGRQIRI